ncbi:MAG: glycogen/starch/alpha-glucan phosphorylase [Desulfosarcinaceae bacterium]|nr:glycogen/starch/alpha-glucan phosphorylase [Desulfosarcinaceae bacterium]
MTTPDNAPRAHAGISPLRTGIGPDAIAQSIRDHLHLIQARFPAVATPYDHYMAVAFAVRDRLLERWTRTAETYYRHRSKSVCYLSAEFLLGPQLGSNLLNLGLMREVRQALDLLGLEFDEILAQEQEPGLGNGGLGRLAACYLDSMATLEIASISHGIRYEFGIFAQEIVEGWQVERADKWLRLGNPWEIARPEIVFDVMFGGHTEIDTGAPDGAYRVRWIPETVVRGMAYDTPIAGYGVNTVNLLRLWKAEAVEEFDFQLFNRGDYYQAVLDKVNSENITKVLYPNDEQLAGKALRLKQQYFFVSCALQDLLRLFFQKNIDLRRFADEFFIQLNDTHPAVGVAEFMRLLVDVHALPWETAWEVTQGCFGYTNHTLMPEALEKWPLSLFGHLLPRHLEIIYEINQRFLDEVRVRFPDDTARVARLSLIEEGPERQVRMAHLACVASRSINGVAALHTDLLTSGVLQDFYALNPEKFNNKTNGVSPRRFLLLSNPELAGLITDRIGDGWITDLAQLRKLEALAQDPDFVQQWATVKRHNKTRLAKLIHARLGMRVDPTALFDIQVKRLHEYKRQHLNLLHIITLYNRLRQDTAGDAPSRVCIFSGKAAPGYRQAKLIIRLIHAVADTIHADPAIGDRLKVVFLPDFNVTNAQMIYPAADLSEQISTAGMEASGTGNMKFALNGALTIGTLDGANIEIREEVGADNFFRFGLTAGEVKQRQAEGVHPRRVYDQEPELKTAVDQIASGVFLPRQPDLFHPLTESLLNHDPFMLLADYASYIACQERVGRAFLAPDHWHRMSIRNTARMGKFSSDRAIREYCQEIWQVSPQRITMPDDDGAGP